MSNDKEEDFGKSLQSLIHFGGSIRNILEHVKFLERLRRFARRRDFSVFRGERSEDDLCQDICLKLLLAEIQGKLRIPGNVETEEQFFTWLFFVVRNHHLDTIRKRSAQKRDGHRSYKSLDDFDFPALEIDQSREDILSQFPEFIERYPKTSQLMIRLWLKGKSYRRIAQFLKRIGQPKVSHTTIGKRVNAIIEDYRASLESRDTLTRTGT